MGNQKHLYIIDIHSNSHRSGVNSFVSEFIHSMKGSKISLTIIIFNSDVKEFCISEDDGITKMLFPVFSSDMFLNHVDIIDKFFRLYIPDLSENIFLINYLPCETLLISLGVSHPLSKSILVIHDLSWTYTYNGNQDLFIEAINKKQKTESEKRTFDFYLLEKRMYSLADKIVCLSNDTYTLLSSLYKVSLDKLVLIPNGLRACEASYSTETIRKEFYISENELILLFVGRPTLQKGFLHYYKLLRRLF